MDDERTIVARVKNSAMTTKIDEIIKNEGLSRQSFAEAIDVSVESVNGWARGSNPLPLEKALIISQTYHKSLDWLYGLSDDTGDDAGRILLYLEEFFKIKRVQSSIYEFTVEMDKNVLDFLIKISEARKAKEGSAMPDHVLSLWIDSEKKTFNDKYKCDTLKETVQYALITEYQLLQYKGAPTVIPPPANYRD